MKPDTKSKKPQPSTMHSVAVQLIADRLAIATGMDPRSLDASRLQWIVDARCNTLHLPDSLAYAAHLQSVPEELDTLIDEVVVQETRFFRDPAVFAHLRSTIPKLAAAFPGELRILSAPCGTGQEAYSLAATLHDLNINRFHIDAVDISLSALAFARNAIYPEQAVKPLTDEQRTQLAHHEHHHWKIHPTLRKNIHFDRRNLAEPNALNPQASTGTNLGDGPGKNPDNLGTGKNPGAPGPDSRTRAAKELQGPPPQYHLILCRNLFIYLHPEARANLSQSLADALIPGGTLVIGSADRVEELSHHFAPQRPAASFAFTHRTVSPIATEHARTATVSRAKPSKATTVSLSGGRRGLQAPVASQPTKGALAPEGRPPEPTQADTAETLYNRALHHQQQGNLRSAERRCRQALYLVPTYLPALELLQTLWHQQPNQRLRHALTARILRTKESQSTETPHN